MSGLISIESRDVNVLRSSRWGPFRTLFWISLALAVALGSSGYLWKKSRDQQLVELKETAKRNLDLQRGKIQEELGHIDLSLIPILGKHPVVDDYFDRSDEFSAQALKDHLGKIIETIPHRGIFVGDASQFILSSPTFEIDQEMISKAYNHIAARAFKGKKSQLLLFSEQDVISKFLMVMPLADDNGIRGVMGLILNLSDFQDRMAHALSSSDDILVVSDHRGIIMLSSNPAWRHRTLSVLPYGVKKNLNINFERQELFSPLGVANINQDIITLEAVDQALRDQSYLVHSVMLTDYPLRLHHLSNIIPVEKTSALHGAVALISFVLTVLLFLLSKEKRTLLLVEKGHQDRLRESEAHKHQIIEATASGLITFHHGGRIVSINQAARLLIGDKMAQKLTEVSQLFIQPHIMQKVACPKPTDLCRSYETLIQKGERAQTPVQISIKPMGFGKPPLYLLTLIDISDKKNTEAELEQHQKMAAMGMMATTLAHEISQPITSIKTEAAIGWKYLEKGNSQEAQQSLKTIEGYTQLLVKITSQLKLFARRNKSEIAARTDIYQAIQYSHILYQHRLDAEQIRWSENIDDRELFGQIDEYQLQQVIGNLIQNACDAMKETEEKNITVSVETIRDKVLIEVSDSGRGIGEDLRNSIFDPFVSTKRNNSSMGLGLAICKDIINRANGKLELLKSDQGARFRVTLIRSPHQEDK